MYREFDSSLPGAVAWRSESTRGGLVLPDGCMDLIWSAGSLVVAGPDRRPQRAGPAEYVGLRLAPGTAPFLLGLCARDLLDGRTDVADLLPRDAERLTENLRTAPDPIRGLEAVARTLAESRGSAPPGHVHRVVRLLGAGLGPAEVADALGWTGRTLHRRCVTAFGYGPALLRRILRFGRATERLRAGWAPSEVAAACGYADQPHLTRDFVEFAGTTPGRRHAADSPAGAGSGEGGASTGGTPAP